MKKYILAGTALLLPAFAFAQIAGSDPYVVTDIPTLVTAINGVINLVFPVLVGIAVIVIIWAIFQMVLNAGDEEARKAGRTKLLWGIIGIFLMLSVWGLINILINTIYLDRSSAVDVPVVVPTAN